MHRLKIWIDLDNSPHVPFFVPIIEELKARNCDVLLTGRDNSQVAELVAQFGLSVRLYGHHFGKRKVAKVFGTLLRALQLVPLILRERPDAAVSHGSRSQIVVASLLGLSSIAIFDYEFVNQGFLGMGPKWVIVPEVVPVQAMRCDPKCIRAYPGIKEDVYVPRFRPDPGIRKELGIAEDELLVTLRPPATDAHYHNPMSDQLFECAVEFLAPMENVRMVILARYESQKSLLQKKWPNLIATRKVQTPEHVVDGLNLIWFSDLVISGGGTMNRESAALGVPVYSIFCGKIGAVDRHLADEGRLVLISTIDDVKSKIRVTRRSRPAQHDSPPRPALQAIVAHVVAIAEFEWNAFRAVRQT